MSQVSDITLSAPISGQSFRTELNSILAALNTCNSGIARPGSLTGTTGFWIDTSGGATSHVVKYYDGTDDITIGTINTTANTYTPAGQLATFASAVTAKTASWTLVAGDFSKFFTVDCTSGNVTVTIDPTSGLGTSWYAIVQKIDSGANTVTIDPDSTNTVDGSTTYVISKQYAGAMIVKATSTTFRVIPFGNINSLGAAAFAGLSSNIVNSGGNLAIASDANLPGNPTTTTQSAANDSTRIATTAFVHDVVDALGLGTASTKNTGTAIGNVLDLENVGSVPMIRAVNGSQLTSVLKKARYTHKLSSGTGGGARTAGAWTKQTLNTEVYDDIGITLTSDELSLPAGTYEVTGYSLFGATNFGNATGRIRLYNVTDAAAITDCISSSGYTSTANGANIIASLNEVRFTIASTKTIRVEYYCSGTTAAFATTTGSDEIYADIVITKRA